MNCPEKKKGQGKGDGRQVIKGKGKQKGKKGKGNGKGFGKKGKMNEVGYETEYDGTDMWYQDDGSWWEDQSWWETSQVWDSNWDESWDGNAWTEGQEGTWNEAWSWPAIEDVKPGDSGTQGVQSLVLSPLISEVFASVPTGLVFETAETDSASECSHFSVHETVFATSTKGLQCLEGNRLFCNCANCVEIGQRFGDALEALSLIHI